MNDQRTHGFRLSPQQRRLWSLQQEPNPYTTQCGILLEGSLDTRMLRAAAEQVVDRHEILRTTFLSRPGMRFPLQAISQQAQLVWEEVALDPRGAGGREAAIDQLLQAEQRRQFDLARGPLVRLVLVRVSKQEHVLLVTLPSLCADGSSLGRFSAELADEYTAQVEGRRTACREPLQYAAFAAWQQELLEEEEAEVGKAYWREKQPLLRHPVNLPFERQPASSVPFRPDCVRRQVDAGVARKIESLGVGTAESVFHLACWHTLLWRLSGGADVVVGCLVDGRESGGLDDAIGLFAKFIPVPHRFDGPVRYSEVREATAESLAESEEWQPYFSWDGDTQRGTPASIPGYLAVGFEYRTAGVPGHAAGVRFSAIRQSACIDRFNVKLSCVRTDDTLDTEFHYDANRFSRQHIERLALHYHTLLCSAADSPATAVDELEILDDVERCQLLVEFNDTQADQGPGRCVHDLFEDSVQRAPDRPALVFEDQALTYAELNRRADQLARHLRASGVGPEVLVGICVERGLEMVVGMLGVLKAGGAYVPLDPAAPMHRLGLVLKDAKAAVLLTQEKLRERLPDCGATVIALDTDRDRITASGDTPRTRTVQANNLVYAIFTSGSTGIPKGVLVEHRQLVNYVLAVLQRLDVPDGAHFATVSTFAADLGNTAIFAALCSGGCLHVIAEQRLMDPVAFAEYFGQRPIDCLKIVPSHLDALLTASQCPERILPRQRLVLGGETLTWDVAQKVRALAPECLVFNHYGPTESTVGMLTYRLSLGQSEDNPATVPLGRPLQNTQVYVLDSKGIPSPIGVSGELYIGGAGLARQYLGRAEVTAERFVPDPFSGDPGARLYRTGDRVRYLADGTVEFLGRTDQQVKIRGFRIEPAEIEAALSRHPAVRDTVVIARDDGLRDRRLVAYVVLLRDAPVSSTALREYLRDTLPDYMVPSAFVTLERLPLTRNGKVDRSALPAPEAIDKLDTELVAPRTAVEATLADIWIELLKLGRLSVHDNFFEVGGHSLLAMQLISRIRDALAVELPLRTLFDAPTVAGLAAAVEATKPIAGQPVPALTRLRRDRWLPLSFAQERLWLFDQLQPRSTAYNIPGAIRLKGPLAVGAMQRTFEEIVRRHEPLRTTFGTVDGQIGQRIEPPRPLPLQVVDLTGLSRQEREALVDTLVHAEAGDPFDLTRAPLMRARLLQLDAEEHVLLFTVHHIASDAWSSAVFAREAAALYAAFAHGRPSPLADLPVHYADYAVWQRSWLDGGDILETQLAYWRERLSGAPPALDLHTDHPRPAVQTFRGGSRSMVLSELVSQRISELSRQQHITPFMTLLAAFQALLHRHTGQEDILVGAPIAGRNRVETEGLIGFFLNTLVVRTDLSGDPTFRDLLGRVRDTVLGAFGHQDVPLEKIVEALRPERDTSRTPFFQVMFNLQTASTGEALTFPGLDIDPLPASEQASKFDLTLYVIERAGGTRLRLAYNADLFEADTAAQLLDDFQRLLEEAVSDPQRRISSLRLRKRIERLARGELVPRSQSFQEFPADHVEQSIAQRFELQARLHPRNVAIATRDADWTYDALNQAADRVRDALVTQHDLDDARVALLFDASASMIAALVGTLKAGKVYVPLDPAHPKDRLEFLIADAQASVILTDGAHVDLAARLAGALPVVDVETLAAPASQPPPAYPSPDSLAYILYTSGSTGTPKGVVQNHRNVLHFIRVYTNNLKIRPSDRLSLLSSYGFDAAVMDIFGALLNGATLVPRNVRDEGLLDLPRWVADHGITIYHSTPTVFRFGFGSGNDGRDLSTVRLVVLGGEETRATDVDLFRGCFSPHCVFVNGLGPTESTVTLQHFIDPTTPLLRPAVPVGFPVEGTEVMLLDAAHRDVAVYGEIAIRSPHVAVGYWQQPELTAAAFLPDPDGGNRRIYLTGDLGRLLPDGSIEFVGRRDLQVKIRGFRVELGEVEAVLSQHPAVRECAVVARKDRTGTARLVAYVLPSDGERPTVEGLRAYLKEKLPDTMVPDALVVGESLPLTPNGKLDRHALPEVDESAIEPGAVVTAPRTPYEEILATLWCEVFGVNAISTHDDFFDLGGHSLLAMRLVSRIRSAFAVDLPLRSLFETPTIAGLSETIQTLKRSGDELRMPPMQAVSRDGLLPLSFAQQRMWFLDRLEPGSAAYVVSSAVRLHGGLRVLALEQALDEILRRHEVLRTSFRTTTEGDAVQRITPPTQRTLPIVDVQELPEAERARTVQRLITDEAHRPFDLATDVLLRVTVLRLDHDHHVALFTMHHIVSDAWSTGLLIRELSALYEAFSRDLPSPLPALPVQYADFADWQRRWLTGEVLDRQLAYWKAELDGAAASLDLPLDFPRPPMQTFSGARQRVSLPKRLADALTRLSRDGDATLFMTLMAALQVLLFRYTGQDDILVGFPAAGRSQPETDALIGFFVNTMTIRGRPSADLSFKEFLRQIREQALGAYAHEDLPFEKLVDELRPNRDLSRTPLFQVVFALENAPSETLQLEGLTLRAVELERRTAKFDLTLSLAEYDHGLTGHLDYNTDLFRPTTIARMLRHFEAVLEAVVADPAQALGAIPLLSDADRQHLIVEWNDRQSAAPFGTIHTRFEAQAARTPDRVAVAFEDQQLTYRELNAQANRLAHHLQALGVGPDERIGLCVQRSVETVVAILGILKAGGAYLPLDADLPIERLSLLLTDADVRVLLTQEGLVNRLPQLPIRIIRLDADASTISGASAENPVNDATAGNLAYVMYTSGSTGIPKGVEVPHRAVLRLLFDVDYVQLEAGETVLHLSSPSFDASTFEIWAPLLWGGTCVLFADRVPLPEDLRDAIETHGVTTMWLTASLFNAVIDRAPEALGGLRQLLIGGEALSRSHVQRAYQHLPATQIINGYGPTESTTFTCCHAIPRALPSADVSIPIGRPIGNTDVYLLDARLEPVPLGATGELHIGGAGLARGYLRRPALTAERFIPDRFSEQPGARLYKSGDLARYHLDGTVEFLGRRDNQVKIRGFRIELGEIEAALRRHPAVQEAVVLAREDRAGDKRLVAYVVADPAPAATELRTFVERALPNYMVPAAFVALISLPLTPTGKVDRRALPAPERRREDLQAAYVPPSTPAEQRLANIWRDVLGLEQVGVHDNFFELGGDSILSIRIVAKANEVGLQLTPKQLFEHQTVASLAAAAGTISGVQAEQGLVVGNAPLTPIQHWFFEQSVPEPHHFNQAVSLDVREALDAAVLEQAITQLLLHHDALRLHFHEEAHHWRQVGTAAVETSPVSLIDLSALAQPEQGSALEAAAAQLQESLRLAEGPLFRVALFELGQSQPSCLLIIAHHLVVDGVSWRILLEDLQTAYEQARRREAMQLPPKTTAFAHWGQRLTQHAESDDVLGDLAYWMASSDVQPARVPVDDATGQNSVASARTVTVSLTSEETRSLLQEIPQAYHTQINDALLTALVQAFADWTGNTAVLVDVEGHGREDIFDDVDLSRTVGWFTTIYPVWLRLPSNGGPREALTSIKEQLRGVPSRGLSYGLLRYLRNAGDAAALRSQPAAQVSFNYLGQFDQSLKSTSHLAWSRASIGPTQSPRGTRLHVLDVTAILTGGQLHVSFRYSENLHRRVTVEHLAQAYIESLRALITGLSTGAVEHTPSDFPLAKLDADKLGKLSALLAKVDAKSKSAAESDESPDGS